VFSGGKHALRFLATIPKKSKTEAPPSHFLIAGNYNRNIQIPVLNAPGAGTASEDHAGKTRLESQKSRGRVRPCENRQSFVMAKNKAQLA
jgi:hypothetical protein